MTDPDRWRRRNLGEGREAAPTERGIRRALRAARRAYALLFDLHLHTSGEDPTQEVSGRPWPGLSEAQKKETRGHRAAHVGAVAAGPVASFPSGDPGKHVVADRLAAVDDGR